MSEELKDQPARFGLAAIWMTGAIVSFTTMAVAGRYVAVELDTFELMLYRSLIGIIIVLTVASVIGTMGEISTKKLHLQIARNIFHFTGQNLWFFALTLVPLAQLIALEFTTPLWVILLAPVFLGERLTWIKVVSAAIGFVGILIVAQPGSVQIGPGLIAATCCAIGFAGAMIFTKILTRSVSVTCILFWLVATQSVFGLISAGWDGDIALPSRAIWIWVVLIACCGLLAHLSITKALTLAPASIIGPVDFLRLPLIAIVGFVLFSEPLDAMVLVGACFIIFGNYLNLRFGGPKRTQR